MRVIVILACLALPGCGERFEIVDEVGSTWSCPLRAGACTLVAPSTKPVELDDELILVAS